MNMQIQGKQPGIATLGTEFDQASRTAEVNSSRTQFIEADVPGGKSNTGLDHLGLPPPTPGATPESTLAALLNFSSTNMQADMFSIMALMTQLAQQQRSAARELRHSEMQAQVASLQEAAQQIRNAAADRLTGAILAGVMQIGAGAMQIGGAAMSLSRTNSALTDYKDGKMSEDVLRGALSAAGAYSTFGDGASKIGTATGQMASAGMEFQAAKHDAQKAEEEATAKAHDAQTQQANDLMQQMQDIIRDIRDKLSSIEQSRVETNRGIARNI